MNTSKAWQSSIRIVLATLLLLAAPALMAQQPSVFSEDGLAIRGYDPVAYFTLGEATLGSDQFEAQWNGATWRFSSAEHRERFVADPAAYAPQYGGYCAWAVSRGSTASIDPHAWTIHDGALYLNYNRSIHQRWQRDIPGNIARGDANWPGLLE